MTLSGDSKALSYRLCVEVADLSPEENEGPGKLVRKGNAERTRWGMAHHLPLGRAGGKSGIKAILAIRESRSIWGGGQAC